MAIPKKIKKVEKSKKKKKTIYSKLTTVRFRVGKKLFEVDFADELIMKKDLHSEVERIPAIMGYLGTIISNLEAEYNNKYDLKRAIEASIDRDVRKTGQTGEVRIDKAIKRDPRWIEACTGVNKAKEMFEKARYIYQALRKKSDSAVSRSNDIRQTPSDSIIKRSNKEIMTFREKTIA